MKDKARGKQTMYERRIPSLWMHIKKRLTVIWVGFVNNCIAKSVKASLRLSERNIFDVLNISMKGKRKGTHKLT
jgi:hypothetical protein